jgi:hypothetical protein
MSWRWRSLTSTTTTKRPPRRIEAGPPPERGQNTEYFSQVNSVFNELPYLRNCGGGRPGRSFLNTGNGSRRSCSSFANLSTMHMRRNPHGRACSGALPPAVAAHCKKMETATGCSASQSIPGDQPRVRFLPFCQRDQISVAVYLCHEGRIQQLRGTDAHRIICA